MSSYVQRLGVARSAAAFILVAVVGSVAALPLLATNEHFSVPDDLAVRIRLDDTRTSIDSQGGDPFSATAVDKGDYQSAQVYGHFAQIGARRPSGMTRRSNRNIMLV